MLGISKALSMAQHTGGHANTGTILQHAHDTPRFTLCAPAQQHIQQHTMNENDTTMNDARRLHAPSAHNRLSFGRLALGLRFSRPSKARLGPPTGQLAVAAAA